MEVTNRPIPGELNFPKLVGEIVGSNPLGWAFVRRLFRFIFGLIRRLPAFPFFELSDARGAWRSLTPSSSRTVLPAGFGNSPTASLLPLGVFESVESALPPQPTKKTPNARQAKIEKPHSSKPRRSF